MEIKNLHSVWLSWHKVPRSRNITKYLDIPLFEYFVNENPIKRHLYSSIWTIKFLIKNKPDIVYLHYSYLLLLIIALYKNIVRKKVVIISDCHNKALRRKVNGFAGKIYERIKKYSFNNTDIAIITNEGVINDIKNYCSNYFILPDKIPDFKFKIEKVKKEIYCVYISTFSVDEPIREVLEAAEILGDSIKIYWTGRKKDSLLKNFIIPANIEFTNYLEYNEYYQLIANADCLLLLTTEDNCLQCGAYEGLNANVPMVISNNKASRNYFEDSAIYTEINASAIANSIEKAINNSSSIKTNANYIKAKREEEFEQLTNELKTKIESEF